MTDPKVLAEKIDSEFNMFFLDKMRTSKENIFACSEEIELKKIIRQKLVCKVYSLSEAEKEVMVLKDSLLESAYRFIRDRSNRRLLYAEIDRTLNRWIEFLQS